MGVDHSAADPALGYLYQCRIALLLALEKLRGGEEFIVAVETLDDVTFEGIAQPAELLQVKHHLKRGGSLSDASVDLWRTMRVWADAEDEGRLPAQALLFLVTTASVPKGCAAANLLSTDRDPASAETRLLATAETSISKSNAAAYAAFKKLSKRRRRRLLERVTVVPGVRNIEDIDDDLKKTVYFAASPEHLASFLSRLEGWWYRRLIRQMAAGGGAEVGSSEIQSEITDLQEQFKQDSLPIDPDILDIEFSDAEYKDALFVEQLNLIQVNPRRIFFAIRNYLRAFEQRSRWVREDLLLVGELERYENRLVEEWEVAYERMKDTLPPGAAENAKLEAARSLYAWAEDVSLPIRDRVTEPFVTRGSLHILADDLRTGWHPDFMSRLAHLLECGGGAE